MSLEPELRELENQLTSTDFGGGDPVLNVLTSALNDPNPPYKLSDILAIISAHEDIELNALDLIPLLWSHISQTQREKDDINDSFETVKHLFGLVAERASAKECLIGLQESLEALVNQLNTWDEREHEGVKEEDLIARNLSLLLDSFSHVIPRLKLRKKSPLETLKPTLKSTLNVLHLTTSIVTKEQVPQLLDKFLQFLSASITWSQNVASTETDKMECKDVLTTTLLTSITSCCPHVQTSLTEEYLEEHFPRRYLHTAVTAESLDQKQIMARAVKIAQTLDLTPTLLIRLISQGAGASATSLASLVLLAHWPMEEFPPQINQLATMRLCIEYTLTNSVAVDECLFLLMTRVDADSFPVTQTNKNAVISTISTISENDLIPLIQSITSLAASSPDSIRRNSAFVTLSLLLKRLDPPARLVLLAELLSPEDPFPQMRVAAIGLVKESVFDAFDTLNSRADSLANESAPLGKNHKNVNVFTSPQLLAHLGRYILRPEPMDLFDSTSSTSAITIDVEEFFESVEPARLTECLGFYYALLQRDAENLTGVKDKSSIAETRRYLLEPLSKALKTWNEIPDNVDARTLSDIPQMPRVSLEIAVERVFDALGTLQV